MSDERLATLERRVAALEERLETRPASTPGAGDPGADELRADEFWALAGLEARVADPGAVMLVGTATLPDGRAARWQEGALTGDLLDGDWAEVGDVLAALGHPVRRRLLQLVTSGTSTVPELTAAEGVGSSGQVYHHLRQLVSAGWLRALGGGRYEVPVARVVPLLAVLLGARR